MFVSHLYVFLEKLLEDNISKTLSNINHSRIFYDPPPRILEIKAKINKWNLIKIKSFCTTKETIRKFKRQPSEWEKIIANEATDKQLISKNIQATRASQFQKNKWPNQKMGRRHANFWCSCEFFFFITFSLFIFLPCFARTSETSSQTTFYFGRYTCII